jgi:hypothetical protein
MKVIILFFLLLPHQMVYVEWIDIIATDGGWRTEEELNEWIETEHDTVRQVGFIFMETDRFIVLTDSYFNNGLKGYAVKIPKGCIIKIKELN